ncbi:MAG: hypothetical protein AAFY60_03960 [Myxococcota bacterium]
MSLRDAMSASGSLRDMNGPLILPLRPRLEALESAIQGDGPSPATQHLGAYEQTLALLPELAPGTRSTAHWRHLASSNTPERVQEGVGTAGDAGMSAALLDGQFERLAASVAAGSTRDASMSFRQFLGKLQRLESELVAQRRA